MKTVKNIIKRIIVGIGVAIGVMLIKQNVFAQVYTTNTGGYSWSSQDGSNQRYDFNLPTPAFAGAGHGEISFMFSIFQVGQTSSNAHLVSAQTVFVSNSAVDYICNIGSVSTENMANQYVNQTYSVTCPFDTTLSGLTKISIRTNRHIGGVPYTSFDLILSGLTTFVSDNTQFLPSINQTTGLISQQLETINGNITTGNNTTANVASSIQNQTTATTNAINQSTTAINDASDRVNNTLTNDSTTEAETTGGGFFNNFNSNSHGVSGIVTAPLRLMQSLTTANCQPLQFQLPFVHNNVTLQCMRPVLSSNFPTFFTLFQLISTGVIGYMVMINIFAKVHDLQDPNNDRIEVLSL